MEPAASAADVGLEESRVMQRVVTENAAADGELSNVSHGCCIRCQHSYPLRVPHLLGSPTLSIYTSAAPKSCGHCGLHLIRSKQHFKYERHHPGFLCEDDDFRRLDRHPIARGGKIAGGGAVEPPLSQSSATPKPDRQKPPTLAGAAFHPRLLFDVSTGHTANERSAFLTIWHDTISNGHWLVADGIRRLSVVLTEESAATPNHTAGLMSQRTTN
ncbi:hypothetical protein J1614_001566 [Plenodomus biglobosus]|nr:hypothetical protein J1614_001566 [Plenodomus biglobosus]